MLSTQFLKNILPAFMLLILLSACTRFKDLTPTEFATQEHHVKTVELDTTIHKVLLMHPLFVINNLYDRCIPKIEPTTHQARIWWEVGGLKNMATMALIKFEQKDLDIPKVTAKIYAADSIWAKKTEKYIQQLKTFRHVN